MEMQEFAASISSSKHAPATADSIAKFEKEIGNKLPDDYREFLMKCGGGYIEDDPNFHWPEGHWAGTVNTIGGLRDDDSDYSLRYQLREAEWPLPKDVLWIMTDSGGNPIGLMLSGDEAGKLYFLEHEVAPEEDSDEWDGTLASAEEYGYAMLLAPSFSAFVDGLYTGPSREE